MKLDRKGYMLVEIVVSFVVAMGIAYYLMNLTFKFKNADEDIYYSSLYTKDQVSVTKNIMNDLARGKITSFNNPTRTGNNLTMNFTLELDDGNIENRRISTVENNGKFIIYYGKLNGDDYDINDISYYEKELQTSLQVGDVRANPSGDDSLGITIPLSSLYTDDSYDIHLFLQVEKQAILQNISSSYSEKLWEYKENITKIVLQNTFNPIANADKVFDISSLENGTVMAYLVKNGTTYTAYIQANKRIYANPDSSNLFSGFKKLESIENLDLLDTSLVNDMSSMFKDCNALESLNLSNFDTHSVVTMSDMFSFGSSLSPSDDSNTKLMELDLSSFDTGKVINMSSMFFGADALVKVIFGSGWNTSQVTSMNSMFADCDDLASLDLNRFNTSNVTDMSFMFYNCEKLLSVDLSHFDTSKVTDMSSMFAYSPKIITEFTIRNETTNVQNMFYNAITDSGSKVILNYVNSTSSLVENIILDFDGANVEKGKLVS